MPPKFSSNSFAGRLVYMIILPLPLFFIVNFYNWVDNKLWVLMLLVTYFLLSGFYLFYNCLDWDLYVDNKNQNLLFQRFSQKEKISSGSWEVKPIPLASQLFGVFKLTTSEKTFVFKYKPVHYLFFKNVKGVTENLEKELQGLVNS